MLLVLGLAVAGCGGSDADSSAASSEAPATSEAAAATSAAPAPSTSATPSTSDAPATSAAPVETTAAPETVESAETAEIAETVVPVAASTGCGFGGPESGSTRETLGDREYLQYVPQAHDGENPLPLVLNFHALSSNASQQVLLTGLDGKGEAEGFIAVHPEGTTLPGTEIQFWNTDISGSSPNVDDVGFVAELLDHLEDNLCVDTNRIFTTGMSNGGFMSSALSCVLSERFAAATSVAGISFAEGDCDPSRAVPLLHVHGTADVVVPFEGGDSTLLSDGGTLEGQAAEFVPIPGEVGEWAAEFGCSESPVVSDFGDDVTVEEYQGCAADIEFWIVEGGGHTWPGTPTALALQDMLGFSTDDFNTTDLAWEWFVAHPKS